MTFDILNGDFGGTQEAPELPDKSCYGYGLVQKDESG